MIDLDVPTLPLVIAAVIVLSAIAMPMVPSGGPSSGASGTVQTPDPVTADVDESGSSSSAPTPTDTRLYRVPESHTETETNRFQQPDVRSSAGSQSMQVRVTDAGGEPAVVLEDEEQHEGRWVSIPTQWFRNELGRVPMMVSVQHSSGETYTTRTFARSSGVAFYIEEFSTNTVTFSGTTSISASPATDGASFSYELADLDSASDPVVNLTGSFSGENETKSGSLGMGESTNISVFGNAEPVGQVDQTPVLSLTGHGYSNTITGYGSTSVTRDISGVSGMTKIDGEVDVADEDIVDGSISIYIDGDKIYGKSWSDVSYGTGGNYGIRSFSADVPNEYSDGDELTVSVSGPEIVLNGVDYHISPPKNVTASNNQSGAVNFGDFSGGETKTKEVALSTGANKLTISGGGGNVNYELQYRERVQTANPAVELNGVTKSHSGTLADGETTSLSLDSSALQEGTNRLNVSVGDGTLSTDAPAPVVGVDYSHTSAANVSTTYTSGKWVESYNVSHTYADSRENATLTIPFTSSVYAIETVETRSNSSAWSSTTDYTLDNTTLTVQLGNVTAGEAVTVRTTGYRVQPVNASITVAQPTTGDELDSRIRVDSWDQTESYLSLGGTPDGDRLHYIHDASYSQDHELEVTANGYHRLYLPNSGAGDEFNVSTVPYRVNAQSGEMRYTINDTSESRFLLDVSPGDSFSDAVEYTYLNATDGETYVLYSEDAGIVRDQQEANSPVTLVDDDSAERLAIFADSGPSASSGSGGGSAGAAAIVPTSTSDPNFLPLAGIALALGLLVIVSRNNETVTAAGSETADVVGGAFDGVPVLGPAVGGALSSVIRTGSQLVAALFEERIIAVLLGGAITVGAVQGGIINLGPSTQVLVAIVGVGIGSLVALQEIGEFTARRWFGLLTAATIVALQTLGNGDILSAVVDSPAFPLVILGAVAGGLWLIQGVRQGLSTPDQVTEVVVQGSQERDN
ncbi:hypothetical protein DVK02_12915 [Halobellus sp. Atlit-31R]|nr:hypothetical protein DVK02_12915 [Halobellus sp. Atlit-31R]